MTTAKVTIYFKYILLLAIIPFVLLSCAGSESDNKESRPFVPQNITASPGSGQVTLSWDVVDNDSYTSVTGFNIYLASQSGVSPSNYNNLADGKKIGPVASPYTITCLNPNKTYYFVITSKLVTGIGGLPYTTGESYPSAEVSATPAPATLPQPSTPTGLSANASVNQATLSWNANSTLECIDSYTLYMATTPWSTWSDTLPGALRTTGITYPYFTQKQLDNGTTYWFAVTASNFQGTSNESPQVSATPASLPTSISFDLNEDGKFIDDVYAQSGDVITPGAKRTYKAFIKNQLGSPMPGVTVDWTSSQSGVATTTPVTTVTDARGIATTTIEASTIGDTTITIADTGLMVSKSISLSVANKLSNITSASAGYYHSCVATANGSAKCWGYNQWGRLGDGTQTNSSIPVVSVGLETGTSSISLGQSHTCATVNGAPKCWGYNNLGQLGRDDVLYSTVPADVMGLSEASSISSGGAYSCAITATGGVKCWGFNNYGALGNGSYIDSNTPVDVVGLGSGVSAVSTGRYHACAITTAGGVKCWGYNYRGQLGDGTTVTTNTPVDVTGLTTGVVAISAGGYHTCAITNTGGLKCWGYNSDGQLGNGTLSQALTPVDVTGLSEGVSAISAGDKHTCAVTTAGGVKCWGYNNYAQLGNGSTTRSLTPVDVSDLGTGISTVTSGETHSCAVTLTGEMKCWGNNAYGTIGDGTLINRIYPTDVISQ